MNTREFIMKVLEESKAPLSYRQIYTMGTETYGLTLDYKGDAKNIPISISSLIRQDLNANGEQSVFIKKSSDPALYGLRSKTYRESVLEKAIKDADNDNADIINNGSNDDKISESDLHPVLVKYLYVNSHFKCRTKTIVQQQANNRPPKGIDKWRYPDLIGVYDILDEQDYEEATIGLMQKISASTIKVFSFEVKLELKPSDVREKYFQAVSNSSWANEGYLVAKDIDEDNDALMKELSLLNNLFGVGVIHLNISHPSESTILFASRIRDSIDFASLNVLINRAQRSTDGVRQLVNYIRDRRGDPATIFDKIYDDEALAHLSGLSGRKK